MSRSTTMDQIPEVPPVHLSRSSIEDFQARMSARDSQMSQLGPLLSQALSSLGSSQVSKRASIMNSEQLQNLEVRSRDARSSRGRAPKSVLTGLDAMNKGQLGVATPTLPRASILPSGRASVLATNLVAKKLPFDSDAGRRRAIRASVIGLPRSTVKFRDNERDSDDGSESPVAANKKPWAPKRRGSKASVRRVMTSNNMDVIYCENVLHECPIFQGCDKTALYELARRVFQESFEPGQDIIERGKPTPNFLFVLRGVVDFVIDGITVSSIYPGSHIGEVLLLGIEKVWTVTCKAHTSCTIGVITRVQLLNVAAEFPEMKQWLKEFEIAIGAGYCSHSSIKGSCSLFEGMSEEGIMALSRLPVTRLYCIGQSLVEEGKPGDEFFILVKGKVSVEIAGRVVNHFSADLKSMCFGELGLLGLQKTRSATVTAQSFCLIRVLYRASFLEVTRLKQEFLHVKQVTDTLQGRFTDLATNFSSRMVRLTDVNMFKNAGCSTEFLTFLSEHLEDLVFLTDQTVVHETDEDKSMYFLNHGSVKIMKGDVEIGRMKQGGVIGEMALLSLHDKRSATVIALETCYAERLHQSVVIRGLELYPEDRDKVFAAARVHTQSVGMLSMSTECFIDAFKSKNTTWQSMDDEFLRQLSFHSVDRIFLPGECITEEGAEGRSMFLLATGQAGIFNKVEQWCASSGPPQMYKKAQLKAGSTFGELAMLGVVTKRSATIKAESLCLLWEVEREAVQLILGHFPGARHVFVPLILKSLETQASQRFLSMRIFKNFGQHFKMLLGLECERRVYFPQDYITRGGQVGDGLYVLNVGEAIAKTHNVTIMVLTAGSHFGALIMLGLSKKCITSLVATSVCHVLIVTRESFTSGLLKYPAPSAVVDLTQSEVAAHHVFKEAVELIYERTALVSRMLSDLGLKGHESACEASELLDVVFYNWAYYTRAVRSRQAHAVRTSRRQWDEHSWALRMRDEHYARVESEQRAVEHVWLPRSCPHVSLPQIRKNRFSGIRSEAGAQRLRSTRELGSGRQHVWQDLYSPIVPPTPKSPKTIKVREERRVIHDLMYEHDLFNRMLDSEVRSGPTHEQLVVVTRSCAH